MLSHLAPGGPLPLNRKVAGCNQPIRLSKPARGVGSGKDREPWHGSSVRPMTGTAQIPLHSGCK